MRAKGEEACASQVSVVLRIGGGGEQVARNLLPRELIERLVLVVAVDYVFTKPISVGKRIVSPASGRIGVASHVQPVTTPTFAETGRSKQFVHDLGIGIGRIIADKGLNLPDVWGKSGQVEIKPTKQSRFVRKRGGLQVFLFEPCQYEAVQFVLSPSFFEDPRQWRGIQRMESPEIPAFLQTLGLWPA